MSLRSTREERGAPSRHAVRLVLVLLLHACSPPGDGAAKPPLSGLLVTLDTTRADALGCYGRTTGITPHLDRLRSEGVLYGAAYTVTPMTLPAHASMLTGLYPLRHGVRANGLWPLPPEAATLAETAQAAGFQTAAIIAAPVLDARFGLAQGFDTYDVGHYSGKWQEQQEGQRHAPEVIDAALAWLEGRDRERPFFLWVHLFDPHSPYYPQPEFAAATAKNTAYPNPRYLGEVAFMDREIGRLLAAMEASGDLASCLVVAVGDHGESLREHGEDSHGAYCYEATLRVPMLLRYPDGHRRGESAPELVSVVDVHPTLAEAMGLSVASSIDGTSLFRRTAPLERGIYFESFYGFLSYGWSPQSGWMDARGKYIHSSTPQLFDVHADPGESEDLIVERAAEVPDYVREIAKLSARPALRIEAALASDEEMVSNLRDLGYAGIGLGPDRVPAPLAPSDLPCPQSMVREHQEAMHAVSLSNAGRFAESEEILQRLLRTNPRNYEVLDRLSFCLIQQGRHEEAIPHLRLLVQDGPRKASQFFNLGVCLLKGGRSDEAITALQQAVDLAPRNTRLLRRLGAALHDTGREEEALRCAERILAVEAGS